MPRHVCQDGDGLPTSPCLVCQDRQGAQRRTAQRPEVSDAIEAAFRNDPPPLRADTLAELLNMRNDERTVLSLRTIGAVDFKKADRQAERKRRDAAYRLVKRSEEGATPRAQSAGQREPWKALNLSRQTYYRRLAAATLPGANCRSISSIADGAWRNERVDGGKSITPSDLRIVLFNHC